MSFRRRSRSRCWRPRLSSPTPQRTLPPIRWEPRRSHSASRLSSAWRIGPLGTASSTLRVSMTVTRTDFLRASAGTSRRRSSMSSGRRPRNSPSARWMASVVRTTSRIPARPRSSSPMAPSRAAARRPCVRSVERALDRSPSGLLISCASGYARRPRRPRTLLVRRALAQIVALREGSGQAVVCPEAVRQLLKTNAQGRDLALFNCALARNCAHAISSSSGSATWPWAGRSV